MESQKSNKGVIVLLVIIIAILSVLCVLFATGTISLNSNNLNDNGINDNYQTNKDNNDVNGNNQTNEDNNDKNDNYLKFVIDNENKMNYCQNINGKNYYSYDKDYVVIINNITIKNNTYTFRYEENRTNETRKIYLNNNVAFDGNINEQLLVDVCNYGNYIVYSTGWEGPLYYRIINVNGKELMSFTGKKVTYSNGVLSVEELDKNDSENINDNELIKYQLNMYSENLQKENLTTEKYVCDLNGAGYDC